MKIHILCSKEELKRADEIQDALSKAMKPLTDLGFKGEISIEDSGGVKQEIDKDEIRSKECRKLTDSLSEYNPYRLSEYSMNASFALEYYLHGETARAQRLIWDGIVICAVLEEMQNELSQQNLGANEAREVMEKYYTAETMNDLISQAKRIKDALIKIRDGLYIEISENEIKDIQAFFNKINDPFFKESWRKTISARHKRHQSWGLIIS